MSRLLQLISSAAACVAASASLFADTSEIVQSNYQSNRQNSNNNSKKVVLFDQGLELPDGKYQPAYSAPACICINSGWDFNIYGSFIYWHASQGDMDTAVMLTEPVAGVVAAGNGVVAPNTTGAVAFQNFTYKPGFKVGLGFNWGYDGWVSWAEYTWLHQTVSNTQTAPAATPTPTTTATGLWASNDWFTTNGVTTALVGPNVGDVVSSSWKLNLDMVDFVMSRPCYEGMYMTAMPYAGMRALWLTQRENITLTDTVLLAPATTVATSKNLSHCWSLGPVAGIMGHWMLGCGFRFEGDTAFSVLYTRYTKIAHREQDALVHFNGDIFVPVATDPLKASIHNQNYLRPMAKLGIGMGWGSYFSRNEYYVDLSARYDFNYLWDQNMMREFVGQLIGHPDPAGDLQIHGLTATLRLDF